MNLENRRSPSGASHVGGKDERDRVTIGGVWLEILGPITPGLK
jgi:hypothetical protein